MTSLEQRKTFYIIPQLPERIAKGNVYIKDNTTDYLKKVSEDQIEIIEDKIIINIKRGYHDNML